MNSRSIGPIGLVTALVAGAALLWFLGRLKLLYYFGAFGVDVGSLDLPWHATLFESWFTAQNLAFVCLMWWVALKTRAVWVTVLAVAHALIPIASHYAFAFHGDPRAEFLIAYRHTLLKFVPFVVLAAVWFATSRHRRTLRELSPPLPRAGMALFALVALSWAVSSAKHFGSFDANQVMRDPDAHLSRVKLNAGSVPDPLPEKLYLIHANRESLVLWDRSGFVYGTTEEVRTLTVPRAAVEWLEGHRRFQVQPGDRFL